MDANIQSFKFINRQLDFNYSLAEELVKDISEENMAFSPGLGLENHPAFTLGHLAVAGSMTVEYLNGTAEIPQLWNQLFMRKGPGDPTLPEKDQSLYPNKKELLEEFHKQHEHIKNLLNQLPNEALKEPSQWRFKNHLPSQFDCVLFMCINHESMHLGQLSAWRRAMKLPSAFGKM